MTRIFGSGVLLAAAMVPALLLLSAAPALSQARSAAFEAQNANLANPASAVRIAAIQALTRLQDDEEVIVAVPLIAERLRDDDPAVRIVAARELGHLGEFAAMAVSQIGQALADSDFTVTAVEGSLHFRSVGMAAAAALADLGPVASAALGDLLRALTSKDARLRAAAAKAIGYMSDAASQAAPALVTALSDPSAETRFEAAYALGQIGPLPGPALAALRDSLADRGDFVKALSSGAEVTGSVRVAAAEALLNLGESHLAVIKGYGGEIRQSDEEEPELPWLASRRLRLAADETDIRDLIAVILRANQMTVSFRRDVEGLLTFDFTGMPMQGAFNMLLHEYNLSYEWDERRRHVAIVPYQSVAFVNTATVTAAAPPAVPPRPRPRPRRVTFASSKKTAGRPPVPAVPATPATPAAPAASAAPEKPTKTATVTASKPAVKAEAPARKVTIASKPRPASPTRVKLDVKAEPKATTTTKAKATSKPKATAKVMAKPKAKVTAKLKVEPSRPVAKAAGSEHRANHQAKPAPKRLTVARPAAAPVKTKPASPTDISREHKLSFIIKYDGLFRAMIDGQEYLAGMTLMTAHGAMVIVDIRKRAVHLLRKSAQGIDEFVIQHRRRR